jgi:hypothetical protein
MNSKERNKRPTTFMIRHGLPILLIAACFAGVATAKTSNGNDFALYYAEAQTEEDKQFLFDDAKGRPHFFRYLQILEMEEVEENGSYAVKITAFEPASLMDVTFTVTKRESLKLLRSDPESVPGKAIAVTGKVVEIYRNSISLNPVIVRHKDRLSPAIGKELLCEVSPTATFYSYTGGDHEVNVTYKDRDLLQHKNAVIAKSGKQGWCDFLTAEVAKRNKARAMKANAKEREWREARGIK